METNDRKLALRFAKMAGVTEPSTQKLEHFFKLSAEHGAKNHEFLDFREMREMLRAAIDAIRPLPQITLDDIE